MPFPLDPATPFGARVAQRLQAELVIWMTTVDPNGTPQPSPVWFYWDGDSFLIYSRANTARERNIARNPRVSLHFDSDGQGGNIVVFTGEASIDRAAPPVTATPGYLEKYRAHISRIGSTPERFSLGYPLPIRVRPTRVRGH
jgi:PPOX class probable F420-dependent enzyme